MYQQFRLFALNLTKKEEKNKLTNFFGVEVPIEQKVCYTLILIKKIVRSSNYKLHKN